MGALPLAARAADISDPFEEFYTRHEQAGTLLTGAYYEARQRGWVVSYRNAMVTRFKDRSGLGLELTVSADPHNPPRAGSVVSPRFIVTNRPTGDRQIVTHGSCHTVHGAIFAVFGPDGQVTLRLGPAPEKDGPCPRCYERETILKPGESAELERSTRPSHNNLWLPAKPGRYYVIAQYSTFASQSYTTPTPIDVQ